MTQFSTPFPIKSSQIPRLNAIPVLYISNLKRQCNLFSSPEAH